MKPFLKYLLYRLQLAGFANRLHFLYQRWRNRAANRQYLQQNTGSVIPPDEDLHDTYQLNYSKFIEDGQHAAQEIAEWTSPYLPPNPMVLDWGCGAGRITRQLARFLPGAVLYGCDTNEERIEWNKEHYPGITFSVVHGFTPMHYASELFDLVIGFSVLTHIDSSLQEDWIRELHRIMAPHAILVISTQGKAYEKKLMPAQRKKLAGTGCFTLSYPTHGHRLMSTYHRSETFRKWLSPYFSVLAHYDGVSHPDKLGGQDLWILAKT